MGKVLDDPGGGHRFNIKDPKGRNWCSLHQARCMPESEVDRALALLRSSPRHGPVPRWFVDALFPK
jgi:hypothetical protein